VEKKCSTCGEIKSLSSFYVKRASGDGYTHQCKVCCESVRRKNSASNKERINERSRKYRALNHSKIRESEKKRDFKRRSTPLGKIKNHMYARIWQSLGHSLGGRKWTELVGYDAHKLKAHLEEKFTPSMTWDNHGTYWEIDHVLPISSFAFQHPDDEQFKKCWALTNLQPLTRTENRKKRRGAA
jgi:hypothetical protein